MCCLPFTDCWLSYLPVPPSFLIALYRISHNRNVVSTQTYNLAAEIDRAMVGKTRDLSARNEAIAIIANCPLQFGFYRCAATTRRDPSLWLFGDHAVHEVGGASICWCLFTGTGWHFPPLHSLCNHRRPT
jgi:hypothetical protein